MVIRRVHRPRDVARGERAVVVVDNRELHACVVRSRRVLVDDDVLAATGHDAGARLGEQAQRQLVPHRARGHEQGGLLADPCRERLLQRVDGGILAVHVVADIGLGHGAPHLGRRPGDGIGAEVDEPVGHRVEARHL